MASVVKRGPKWYARFKNAQGEWVKVVGYADKAATLKLAQKLEDEARKIAIGDIDPQADARRIERAKGYADHLALFQANMEANARHPNHVQYTIKDVQRCFDHAQVPSAAALTVGHVDAWRAICVKVGYPDYRHPNEPPIKDSHKTANRRVASVKAFLRFLFERGAVERVVIEKYKRLPEAGHARRVRRALTIEEQTKFLEMCPDEERKELYRFALFTGLRNRECRHITPALLDFKKGIIRIPALIAKSKTDQSVPIHSSLVAMLKRRCGDRLPTMPIFRMPDKNSLVMILKGDLAAADVDSTGIDFHSLRHSFCTRLAELNTRPDILFKLGRHKSIQTTLKYYIHTRQEDEHTALERLSA